MKEINFNHLNREQLNIDAAVLDYVNLGHYSGKGHFHNKLIAPVHTMEGVHTGYFSIDPQSGEIGYPPEEHFNPGRELFNAQNVYNLSNTNPVVMITRSPLTALKLIEKGYSDVVAFFGNELTSTQRTILNQLIEKHHYHGFDYYPDNESDEEMGRIIRSFKKSYMRFFP